MEFKPMTKYFTASEISEKTAYKIIKKRPNGLSKRKPTTFWLSWDSNP